MNQRRPPRWKKHWLRDTSVSVEEYAMSRLYDAQGQHLPCMWNYPEIHVIEIGGGGFVGLVVTAWRACWGKILETLLSFHQNLQSNISNTYQFGLNMDQRSSNIRRRKGCNEECLRRTAIRLCRLANENNGQPRDSDESCCTTALANGKNPVKVDACCGELEGEKIAPGCSRDAASNDSECKVSLPSKTSCCSSEPDQGQAQALGITFENIVGEVKSCCSASDTTIGVDHSAQREVKPCCSASSIEPTTFSVIKAGKVPKICYSTNKAFNSTVNAEQEAGSCCSTELVKTCTPLNSDMRPEGNVSCCSAKEEFKNPCGSVETDVSKSCCTAKNAESSIISVDQTSKDAKSCCSTKADKPNALLTSNAECAVKSCRSAESIGSSTTSVKQAESCCSSKKVQPPPTCFGNNPEQNVDSCCSISCQEPADACCTADETVDCRQKGGDAQAKICGSEKIDGSAPSATADCCAIGDCNPANDVGNSKYCLDDCCSLASQETDTEFEKPCNKHTKFVFERYESLLKQGLCLCRRIIDQLGFCCCSLSHTGTVKDSRACETHPQSKESSALRSKIGACQSSSMVSVMREAKKVAKISSVAVDAQNTQNNHVVLNVSGMTCTGCSNKLMNVLSHVPGVTNAKVTFVSGVAEFDLDSLVSLDGTLSRIEGETGFKLASVLSGFHELHVYLTARASENLERDKLPGVKSVTRVRKNLYCITYDPRVVGARTLLSQDVELAPPPVDNGLKRDRRHLWHMAVAFGTSAMLTIPVLALTWSHNPVPESTRSIVTLVLGTLVQAIAVPEFYVPALRALIYSHVLEMDMLVVISITSAYIYSVVAFGLIRAGIRLHQGPFFEASTLLITLVILGRLVSAFARVRAVEAVSLRSLQIDTALLRREDGTVAEIDARLLQFGDTFSIPAHSRIVTDGVLIPGQIGAVDESTVTGESIPVAKHEGDNVIAGTINDTRDILVRLTRLPRENSISDIANLVENAMGAKPRLQNLADKIASYFVSVVMCIALIVFLIWIAVAMRVRHESGGGAVGTAITYMIAVLAVSCPCALGLAIPMVLVIAGGVAAKAGVIVKAADAFEKGSKISDVVFDKTGTLTLTNLRVVHSQILKSTLGADEILSLTKALVDKSEHPVSAAVAFHLASEHVSLTDLKDITSVPGSGLHAQWRGSTVKAGNPYWLSVEFHPEVTKLLDQGMTLLCITLEAEPLAIYGLKSTLRDEAMTLISGLQQRNITCHIVSGDAQKAVEDVARTLNINAENVVFRSSPVQKQEYISLLQSNGKVIAFCGDGTNDAIAVAQADVGIQIGSASDVTGAVADVVLLGTLDGLVTYLDLSGRAFKRVWLNFAWAGVYNLFAILLAAGAAVKFRIPPAYVGLGEMVSVLPIFVIAGSLAVNRRE